MGINGKNNEGGQRQKQTVTGLVIMGIVFALNYPITLPFLLIAAVLYQMFKKGSAEQTIDHDNPTSYEKRSTTSLPAHPTDATHRTSQTAQPTDTEEMMASLNRITSDIKSAFTQFSNDSSDLDIPESYSGANEEGLSELQLYERQQGVRQGVYRNALAQDEQLHLDTMQSNHDDQLHEAETLRSLLRAGIIERDEFNERMAAIR